ncbi:MAG: J domain-containing protein [Patescibacteria group bacterium]|nr:J domain-containing protein [Patescibacteria group bacterium]
MQSFPLSWPEGWRRTPPDKRKFPRFSTKEQRYSRDGGSWQTRANLSVAQAASRVMAELSHLCVPDDVVISTNIRPRLDGLPRSNEREPDDPGAAIYWQSPQGGRVMAIDAYTTVAGNLAAIAATLEAMRAIERHGGAAILERAFTGFAALPAPGAPKTWREVLGIAPDCRDLEYVRGSYRLLAQCAHPDRGGSHERMAEINAAWAAAQEALG